MYCIERSLCFALIPLKKNGNGSRSFIFNGRSYGITYNSNFDYKNFAVIDCITHFLRAKIFHEIYKKSDYDKPPTNPADSRILNDVKMYGPFIDKDFVKDVYINDEMFRSHPIFRSMNGWEVFNLLKETSNIEYENFNYYYVKYSNIDEIYGYAPIPILGKCKLFDVSLNKKQYGCNLYKIDFTSIFGKVFAYNVNVSNFFLIRDNFYKLDPVGQNLYRFFGLFKQQNISIDIEKIFELLDYDKNKNRTNLTRKIVKQFEDMKNLKLIRTYSFRYNIFEIKN